MTLLAGILLAAAPAAAADAAAVRLAELDQAAFEICPKVYSGELNLGTADAVSRFGYKVSTPAPKPDQAAVIKGSGGSTTLIIGPKQFDPADPFCIVIAGADSLTPTFDGLVEKGKGRGYQAGSPEQYDKDSRIVVLNTQAASNQEIFIMEAAGGADVFDSPSAILIAFFPKQEKP